MRELQKHKIHIAGIRETHISLYLDFARNGYSVITSSSRHNETLTGKQQPQKGMNRGGVAILIREDLAQHIHQIARRDNRLLKVILNDGEDSLPLTILTTYSPQKDPLKKRAKKQWETNLPGYTKNSPMHMVRGR